MKIFVKYEIIMGTWKVLINFNWKNGKKSPGIMNFS